MSQKPSVFTHSIKSAALLAVAAGVVGIAAVGLKESNNSANNLARNCNQESEYNSNLPSSHPNNRCATQEDELSWKSWLSGNSRSGQFHFVDLLELLHGHQRKPVDDMAPANTNNGF
ncbi:hypothetical protein [Shewanella carassii]|uniref:Uncharacterized protein n=1 Tax=Shewanella carassii TaxID=1987584 RepID=A0ABQ1TBH4_9GAMM|nr:hypothetical protein [Shewanella carassii]GGE90564.1 hypothetical protein GCM10011520_33710 [Shewanella carassii]